MKKPRCSHAYSLIWDPDGDYVCCRVCEQAWEFKNGWKPTNGAAVAALTKAAYGRSFAKRKTKTKKEEFDDEEAGQEF